jgi:hypothetical protein
MHARLERLLELSDLPNVTLRVIRYQAGALPAEGLTGDLYLDDPRDVEIDNTTFRTLVQLAASTDATRDIIAAMIPSYRARASWSGRSHRSCPRWNRVALDGPPQLMKADVHVGEL